MNESCHIRERVEDPLLFDVTYTSAHFFCGCSPLEEGEAGASCELTIHFCVSAESCLAYMTHK